MRRVSQFVLVVGAAALLASGALAQQRQGGGRGGMGGTTSPLMLLMQKSVQDELKLTDDQIKQAEELAAKQREARQTLQDLSQEERGKKIQEMNKANEKAVSQFIKPNQAKRLKQISLQLAGAQAFINPEVATELKLTDEQKQKIKEIRKQTAEEARTIRENTTDQAEARQKTRELNRNATGKVMALLTAEQKDKWKEMTGEPFKGEISRGRRGGGASGR